VLRRTGHWWTKGRVWYYEPKRAEKTADKPHPVAVGLALLSPLLAVVATCISLGALYTSQKAMTVSQRAYISISDGYLSFSGTHLNYAFTVRNLGNTPAASVLLKYLYRAPFGVPAAGLSRTTADSPI
jgi:hypothetical protein